jgi:hypothetical protein
MALNYTQLKTAIQDYLQDTNPTFIADLDVFIRQAESRIHHLIEIPASQRSQTGSLTTGIRFLTVPTDFQYAYGLFILNANNAEYLLMKDASFIREAYPPATLTGVPRFYGIEDDTTIIVGPTPNLDYPVQLEYYAQPTSIITAGTSWLGQFAEELLLYGCLVEGYTFLKGEDDLWQAYEKKFQDALAYVVKLGKVKPLTDTYRNPENP